MENNLCKLDHSQYFNSMLNKYFNHNHFEELILNSALYLRDKHVGLHQILDIIKGDLKILLKSNILNPGGIIARELYRDFLKKNVKPLVEDVIIILDTITRGQKAINFKNDIIQ